MKKILFISAISLLCIACNTNSPNKPNTMQAEEQSADWAITTKVKAAIMADGSISATGRMVTVNTTNGVVTLSGGVPTKEEKDRIAQIVKNVEGVVKVNNQLTVTNT